MLPFGHPPAVFTQRGTGASMPTRMMSSAAVREAHWCSSGPFTTSPSTAGASEHSPAHKDSVAGGHHGVEVGIRDGEAAAGRLSCRAGSHSHLCTLLDGKPLQGHRCMLCIGLAVIPQKVHRLASVLACCSHKHPFPRHTQLRQLPERGGEGGRGQPWHLTAPPPLCCWLAAQAPPALQRAAPPTRSCTDAADKAGPAPPAHARATRPR